jgi:hypothetical protein
VYPSSLLRVPQLRTGALRSHQRTWAENDGRSPPELFVPVPSPSASRASDLAVQTKCRMNACGTKPPSVPGRFLLVRFGLRLIGHWGRPGRRDRMRCLRLLSRPCWLSIAKIFHLLRTQRTAWINGLNSPSLLSKRRLHGRGWGLVDERPRPIGRPGSRSLDLGRSHLWRGFPCSRGTAGQGKRLVR